MSDYPITAFPTTESNWFNENVRTEGMMLRDYFAAKALSSIPLSLDDGEHALIANAAYRMADAMLRARYLSEPE